MDPEIHTSSQSVEISEKSSFLVHSNFHSESQGKPTRFVSMNIQCRKGEKVEEMAPGDTEKKVGNHGSAWRRFQGFFFTFLHVLAFASAVLVAKFLSHYHPFTLGIFRYQGVFIPSVIVVIASYIHESKKPEDDSKQLLGSIWPPNSNGNWKRIIFLCVRGFSGCTSVTLILFSLRYIQVGDTLVIQAAAPIFTNLLAYFVLDEPCGVFPVFVALLSILGVGIITRPPLLTGAEEFDSEILIGCLFSFSAMILSVGSVVCLRYLKHVHFAIVSLSFGAWGTFQSLAIALAAGVFEFPVGLNDILLTTALAFLVFVAQSALTFALKREEAGPVMLFRTLNCVVGFVLQKIFLNIPADMYSLIGACLVLLGVAATIGRKQLSTLPKENKLRRALGFVLK